MRGLPVMSFRQRFKIPFDYMGYLSVYGTLDCVSSIYIYIHNYWLEYLLQIEMDGETKFKEFGQGCIETHTFSESDTHVSYGCISDYGYNYFQIEHVTYLK